MLKSKVKGAGRGGEGTRHLYPFYSYLFIELFPIKADEADKGDQGDQGDQGGKADEGDQGGRSHPGEPEDGFKHQEIGGRGFCNCILKNSLKVATDCCEFNPELLLHPLQEEFV